MNKLVRNYYYEAAAGIMMQVNSGGELYLKLGQSRLKNHVEECTYLYLSFQ
jgi:hypothetical protein